jgi:putative heme-binding domain-containing protein
LRQRALDTVAAHLDDEWDTLTDSAELMAALQAALAERGLQESALRIVEAYHLQTVDNDIQRLATDSSVSAVARLAAIHTTIQLAKSDAKVELLRKLLVDSEPIVREAALTALVVDLQDLKTATSVLNGRDDDFPSATRTAVATMSLNTPGGASMMSKLVEAGSLPADLKQQIIAKSIEHPDANVRSLFERFVPADQRQARLGEAISAADILKLTGDAARGDAIFHQNSAAKCMSCHRIHGEGGAVGPGLSTIGSKYDRPQLLETILKPSKAIAPEYVSYTVETTDGRILGGLISKKSEGGITLKDSQGKTTRLPASAVESLVAQPVSMMPELVLRDISAQDAADLLAYLATLR